MRHHTTDPAQRAEHIANRMEREHERWITRNCYLSGRMSDLNWPYYWLETYRQVVRELASEPTAGEARRGDAQ